jgi:hypothetical protein
VDSLNEIQFNVLIASIIGDGEITKIYKNSRRKNNSYREHYGKEQEEYRKWKVSFFDNNLLYLTPKSFTVRSASLPLFTHLYSHFYNENGVKLLPSSLYESCSLPHFLAILYMDDGSLCISHRVNHLKKKIYLTPHIYLYLQCYSHEELLQFKKYLRETFGIIFHISSRKDGNGYILKTTSVIQTYQFLDLIYTITVSCESMYYKTCWEHRFDKERNKWKIKFPNYQLVASSSQRFRTYSETEIIKLIELKQKGLTTQQIADLLQRSYWSVTAKWSEIRKQLLFPFIKLI